MALGLAQQSGKPVALICTSGSAAYNFAPAVAEAFFQQTPLLVLTADRPKEWIDQWDGQTIRQTALFGSHVKRFAELPLEYQHPDNHWHANRLINECILATTHEIPGPVHINIPFREPLYETQNSTEPPPLNRIIQTVNQTPGINHQDWQTLIQEFKQFRNILIVGGQQSHDPSLITALEKCQRQHQVPVTGDILANLHGLTEFCGHSDTFLGGLSEIKKQELKPDLLISFGKSLVSKNLKLLLRKYKPAAHWHIQPYGTPADTFQSLTRIIPIHPADFFSLLSAEPRSGSVSYNDAWKNLEMKSEKALQPSSKKTTKENFILLKRYLKHFLIHATFTLPTACPFDMPIMSD